MLWINQKIGQLVNNINPKDIAFLLASSLEINKAKRSRLKAQIGLDCLYSHNYFKNFIFEFYFKETNYKLRCSALAGLDSILKNYYIGKSITTDSLVHKVFISKKISLLSDMSKEKGRRSEFIQKLKIQSSFFVPVGNFGILVVNKINKEKLSDYEIRLLKSFINEVLTPSLELALDNEKNFGTSIRDPLTTLYNHGYFVFQLDREIENAKRGGNSICLVMIDIDYFKHYNDKNGHPKGDKVLFNVAKILKENTRKGDIVARYGGEEFAIILPNANSSGGYNKAEQIRKAIADFKFDREEFQPGGNLTISLGLADFPLNATEPNELLEKADKALYHSKNNGKNKVSVYGGF